MYQASPRGGGGGGEGPGDEATECPTTALIPSYKLETSATLKIKAKAGFLLELYAKDEIVSEIVQLPLEKLCDISLLQAAEVTLLLLTVPG